MKNYKLGIDIGSTTVKLVLLDEHLNILFSAYERHFANIQGTLASMLAKLMETQDASQIVSVALTGSASMALASALEIPFVQEVVAVSNAVQTFIKDVDVVIELGGEDAKIIFYDGKNIEQRMNGICAGGTGAFIDQMASLLQTDASGLNTYAKDYEHIYPIAARCGVFAKSDIQPLLNDGVSKEDISASIFQAVVNQTISGLAQGKPIKGNVVYLGGPLHYLSELQKAFDRTLSHTKGIVPDHSHLFAAMGSAIDTQFVKTWSLHDLYELVQKEVPLNQEISRLEPLFKDQDDYQSFLSRQSQYQIQKQSLKDYHGNCFLGIDAGSTTTKLALISEEGKLLYSFYSSNQGDPIKVSKKAFKEIEGLLNEDTKIVYSCVTGYGEALLKSAFMMDDGEVETIAHYKAASYFDPNVDCILDIGGQDMKYIRIKNGVVDQVVLNEACSSGCGSFIESFAKSLGYPVEDFARLATQAKAPIDLGSRCTVFMNSRVKQAQKEGAKVEDIAAGLAYSVIKNALYKVIKVKDAKDLGEHIVVQGGTFYNDAVLSSLEKLIGAEVIRPDIAGIMGAFGAALIAKDRYENKNSTLLSFKEIEDLTYRSTSSICQGCANRCRLTINHFDGQRHFITGNRCERGAGKKVVSNEIPNLYTFKNNLVFNRTSLSESEATRGTMGIPRVLNMYENYPFWHTFFTELGYRVVLSPYSSAAIYEKGMSTIPSESECFPAKLVHGHVQWLIDRGVKEIFYPCVPYERREYDNIQNHYNCPIVTSYPENIRNNMEDLEEKAVLFHQPFISLEKKETILMALKKEFPSIPTKELEKAVNKAWNELASCRQKVLDEGKRTLKWMEENNRMGIVLAGRPYHTDPHVNHGIPELITQYGVAVLSEDSISSQGQITGRLNVMDQWMYHSRLYRAAEFVGTRDDLQLIQLNSFGCGLDAITTDQVSDILSSHGKIYTCLKIDEVNNLGGAKIRIRSLLAAVKMKNSFHPTSDFYHQPRVVFEKEMKGKYTILCPQMSPMHFDLIAEAANYCGYNLVVVDRFEEDHKAVETGLKYVNNDACYPSIIVVGEIMEAIHSGKFDMNQTAVIMTQTGGGCRASNYVGFLRRALNKDGLNHVPVVSVNMSSIESNPGFKFTLDLLQRCLFGTIFGDLFMRVVYRMRPYEKKKGEVNELYAFYNQKCKEFVSSKHISFKKFYQLCNEIITAFDAIDIDENRKERVGVVGEILVKFAPAANNHLVDLLETEGAEAVVPDLLDFMYYCFYNSNFKADELGKSLKARHLCNLGIKVMDQVRKPIDKTLKASRHFNGFSNIKHVAKLTEEIASNGNQTGEGWLLTGEMLELVESGCTNIVCTQPFACLPNHIVGKGVIKKIRTLHPEANIVAIDYDAGASEVNQVNRIKLMLSIAKNKKKD